MRTAASRPSDARRMGRAVEDDHVSDTVEDCGPSRSGRRSAYPSRYLGEVLVPRPTVTGTSLFGQRLRALRTERGLSLRALVRLCHYSFGYIQELETGAKMPAPRTAAVLDEALGAEGTLIATIAKAADETISTAQSLVTDMQDVAMVRSPTNAAWGTMLQ